jgi:hypothetical protein
MVGQMDIVCFLEYFRADYMNIVEQMESEAADGNSRDLAQLIGIDFSADKDTIAEWKKIGMSDKDIHELELELRQASADLHPLPNCMSSNEILNYVEGELSELDNKKYFAHLLDCPGCRNKVFKASWFMRD